MCVFGVCVEEGGHHVQRVLGTRVTCRHWLCHSTEIMWSQVRTVCYTKPPAPRFINIREPIVLHMWSNANCM